MYVIGAINRTFELTGLDWIPINSNYSKTQKKKQTEIFYKLLNIFALVSN